MEWKNILMKHFKKKKMGLVLGCGGAKGLSHIGVIKFLEEIDVRIDYIAGSSVGALIGGAYAGGLSIKEIEDIALETDLASTAKLFSPGFGKSGLVSGTKVQEFLTSKFGNKNIEDLKIPFTAVATDIITGQEIHFNKGNLVEAIRASISIPIVFQPVILNNIVLVDGGLVNPVPINVAREMGADHIIAVNVLSSENKPDSKLVSSQASNDVSTKHGLACYCVPNQGIGNENASDSKLDKKSDNKINLEKPLEIITALQRKLEDLIVDKKWIRNFIKHKEKQDLPGMKKIFNQSIKIAQEKIIKQSIELYKPDVLIEPEVGSVNMFEFYNAKEIIEKGYKAAEAVLKER